MFQLTRYYISLTLVLIDNDLKFQCQVDHVKSELDRLCGVSFKLKNYLNVRAAKDMYYACVYSVVSYCIAVRGGILECKLNVHLKNSIEELFKICFPNFIPVIIVFLKRQHF